MNARIISLSNELALVALPVAFDSTTRLLWFSTQSRAVVHSRVEPGVMNHLIADELSRAFAYVPATASNGAALFGYSADGSNRWARNDVGIAVPLAAWNGVVYLASGEMLNAATGATVGLLSLPEPATAIRVAPGMLYVMSGGAPGTVTLTKFDATTHAAVWARQFIGWSSVSDPLLTSKGTVLVSAGMSWSAWPFDQRIEGGLFEYSSQGDVVGCPFWAQNAGNELKFLGGMLVSSATNNYRGDYATSVRAMKVTGYDAPSAGWTMSGGSAVAPGRAR